MNPRDLRRPPRPPTDPAACRAALRACLADPDLPADPCLRTSTARERTAAFALATAVGRCDLFGVWPRPSAGTLSPAVAAAAGVELCDRLTALAADAADPFADAVDLIERRLEAWSAYVGVADALGDPLRPALDAADRCDAALERLPRAWSTVADHPRVRRWRAALAPPHAALPPWWITPNDDR